jgi:pimeloyl-ACP methyl ester carboxylesterase
MGSNASRPRFRAQLTVYPETGHSPNWERPERVAADLEGFVGVRSS